MRAFRGIRVVTIVLMLAGCASDPKSESKPANYHVDRESSNVLVISMPKVERQGDELSITGTVARQAGVEGEIDGYLYVQIISPTGSIIDELALTWTPKDIPARGSGESTYGVQYGAVPPDGSTIRVTHSTETIDTGLAGNGKAAGISAGNAYFTHTPGKPQQPSQPRQQGQPRTGGTKH